MNRLALYFTGPGKIEVREEVVPLPTTGMVLVQTMISAVSAGTEMLVYRNKLPKNIPLDETIKALSGPVSYPMKYGYSAVGRVVSLGEGVDRAWQDRLVFVFHPHESLFAASPDELLPLPEKMEPEDAAFLANMESAVNFVMDGQPGIGERVVIIGQGIVGLLTAALLAQFPLDKLITVEQYPLRQTASLEVGAQICLEPDRCHEKLAELLGSGDFPGADLVYELSGNPDALNHAIEVAGYGGRIVAGSWYGDKQAKLSLGGSFHRNHLRIISSQVSKLPPGLTGRWSKSRRYEFVWRMLERVKPSHFISHRFPLAQAAEAYGLLDKNPGDVLQVIFTY